MNSLGQAIASPNARYVYRAQKGQYQKACAVGPCCVVSESLSAPLRFERETRDYGLARTDGTGPVRATLEKFREVEKNNLADTLSIC